MYTMTVLSMYTHVHTTRTYTHVHILRDVPVLFQVVALSGSYHGDTLGVMEAQSPSPFTTTVLFLYCMLQVVALSGSYHGDTLGAMEAQSPSPFTGARQQPWYRGQGVFLDPPTVALWNAADSAGATPGLSPEASWKVHLPASWGGAPGPDIQRGEHVSPSV